MGWSIGFDSNHDRDIGYGVPAWCDHPGCAKEIHRGLAYVCGAHPYGGEDGCGLFFCSEHLGLNSDDRDPVCARCAMHADPFDGTPDHPRWIWHKLVDPSWRAWRRENPKAVRRMWRRMLNRWLWRARIVVAAPVVMLVVIVLGAAHGIADATATAAGIMRKGWRQA